MPGWPCGLSPVITLQTTALLIRGYMCFCPPWGTPSPSSVLGPTYHGQAMGPHRQVPGLSLGPFSVNICAVKPIQFWFGGTFMQQIFVLLLYASQRSLPRGTCRLQREETKTQNRCRPQ